MTIVYDFSTMEDGNLPVRLIDSHQYLGVREDPLEISDGAVQIASSDSPAYGESGYENYSGIRGAAWRHTAFTNNFYALTHTNQSGPMICCVPGTEPWAFGMWLNIAPGLGLHYWEIGAIGRNPTDWTYFDTVWCDPDLALSPVDVRTMELRYVDGEIAGYADNVHVAGKVTVPAALVGANRHGIQVDNVVDTPSLTRLEIGSYGGSLGTYTTPVVEGNGGFAKPTGNGTSVDLTYPSNIQAGEWLLAIVGCTGGGAWASSGWTVEGSPHDARGNLTQSIHFAHKIATGSENGQVTFSKTGGLTGLRCGVILRISGVNQWREYLTGGGVTTASSTTIASNPIMLLGLHRLGIWASVVPLDATITLPTGWSNVGNTAATGAAITLKVGRLNWDDYGRVSFGTSGIALQVPSGSVSSSTTNVQATFQIFGEP